MGAEECVNPRKVQLRRLRRVTQFTWQIRAPIIGPQATFAAQCEPVARLLDARHLIARQIADAARELTKDSHGSDDATLQ